MIDAIHIDPATEEWTAIELKTNTITGRYKDPNPVMQLMQLPKTMSTMAEVIKANMAPEPTRDLSCVEDLLRDLAMDFIMQSNAEEPDKETINSTRWHIYALAGDNIHGDVFIKQARETYEMMTGMKPKGFGTSMNEVFLSITWQDPRQVVHVDSVGLTGFGGKAVDMIFIDEASYLPTPAEYRPFIQKKVKGGQVRDPKPHTHLIQQASLSPRKRRR
jgi:hypothetical protein